MDFPKIFQLVKPQFISRGICILKKKVDAIFFGVGFAAATFVKQYSVGGSKKKHHHYLLESIIFR